MARWFTSVKYTKQGVKMKKVIKSIIIPVVLSVTLHANELIMVNDTNDSIETIYDKYHKNEEDIKLNKENINNLYDKYKNNKKSIDLQRKVILTLINEQKKIKERLNITEGSIEVIEQKIGNYNYVVNVFFANVRNKPSTKTGKVVTVYKMGTYVKIKTVQDNGWCETEDGLFIHIHVLQKLK